jgi:4-hydroxybenzoate polyprenyltransferase
MKKIIYRFIIYLLAFALIAAFTFASNATSSEPNLAYWIIGGILLVLFLAFVIINEVVIYKKSHQEKKK